MNASQWQLWYLVVMAVLAGSVLLFMLLYRQHHKTTIEADLLLKQMRITGRLRAVADMQKNRLDEFDDYHAHQLGEWETARGVVHQQFGYDIGEMDMPPESTIDLRGLFDDLTG